MSKRFTSSFLTQLGSLLICIFVVHLVYTSVIRPNASAVLQDRAERLANDEAFVPERSIYVTLRDPEQEICFILMFWAFSIIGFKALNTMSERKMLEQDLITIDEGVSVLPEDSRAYMRPMQSFPKDVRERLLPRALMVALQRFESTQDVQNASEAVRTICEGESDRLDSELAMIRYIAWAIPSIGFIGTVRGIGEALSQAYLAVQGDIAGVTESLGVAFNSTFVALVISIVIMLCVHQLQRVQEQLVIDSEAWMDERLLRHLQVR